MNVQTLNKPPVAAVPKPTGPTRLSQVRRGAFAVPLRALIYGPEKIGKSTFAAGAPKPIWIGAENGTHHLEIDRFPQPETWTDVLASVQELISEKHDYQTVVIDPINWLEATVFAHVCKAHGWNSISDADFGRGYDAANAQWRLLLAGLERLWTGNDSRPGMNVILIAHSRVKAQRTPDAESFERYQIAMQDTSSAILKLWVDYVLFARHVTWLNVGKDKKVRGQSDGSRVIETQWTAAYDAGGRPGLPKTLPLSWDAFIEARNTAVKRGDHVKELVKQIGEALAALGDETATKKTNEYLGKLIDTDVERHEEVLNKVQMKLQQKQAETEAKETAS